ncbi:MAG: glycosyltransferase family 9 protein [Kiloniellaceae bacterium]
MATGEARRLQETDPERRPVAVYGRDGRARWSSLWEGNPRILTPRQACQNDSHLRLVNGPGCRPYIDYARMARDFAAVFPGRRLTTKVKDPRLPWRYTSWRCTPGELYTPRIAPRGYIVVEPHVKAGASPNKDWGWARWQALVDEIRLPWVQLGPPGTRLLEGVRHLVTASFMDACAALLGAKAAVLPEGGLHHAAAALDIPAVVIFGGMTSPANTGYDAHINLYEPADGDSPCGQRVPCEHCEAAMAAIRPEAVAAHLEGLP